MPLMMIVGRTSEFGLQSSSSGNVSPSASGNVQPMSCSSSHVMSNGALTLLRQVWVIAGSISRLRDATVS